METITKDKEINQRQVIVLIIMMIPGVKLLILPSYLAQFAGRDTWLPVAIMFAIDFACLVTLLLSFTINKSELSFFDVLNKALTKIGAKIVLALYALFFIYRIIFTYITVLVLMSTTFSMFTNWIGFIFPVLFVLGYNVMKGIKNIARLTEALIFFFLTAMIVIIALSADAGELLNLKPVLADGFAPVGSAISHGTFWFSDCVFLAFLLAKFKPEKKLLLQGSLGFWFGAACTIFFVAVFISLYGELAQYNSNALAKVSGFSMKLSAKSRLDWLLLIMWLSEVIIKTMVMFYCAATSVQEIVGAQSKKARLCIVFGIAALIAVLPLFIDFKTAAFSLIAEGAGRFISYIPQYVIPLALPLLVATANKKTHNKENPAGVVIDPQKNLAEMIAADEAKK